MLLGQQPVLAKHSQPFRQISYKPDLMLGLQHSGQIIDVVTAAGTGLQVLRRLAAFQPASYFD